jgi:enoyl-CoA hydratase
VYEFIKVDRAEGVGILTLNRPERYNAWHSAMRHEVIRGLKALGADDSVRVVVVTGAGERSFCAGQDLAESQTFTGEHAEVWMDEWRAGGGAGRARATPPGAARDGRAAGSGFQFSLLCDIRVGHSKSQMGQPEINAGLPSVTGVWLMWDVLGRSRTTELVLTGRMMEAEECYRLGLLHHLVEPEAVLAQALAVAKELGEKPSLAMRLNKRRLRELTEAGFLEAEEVGRLLHGEAYASGEPQAVMAKFLAKRGK